jgi:hypothetical protein
VSKRNFAVKSNRKSFFRDFLIKMFFFQPNKIIHFLCLPTSVMTDVHAGLASLFYKNLCFNFQTKCRLSSFVVQKSAGKTDKLIFIHKSGKNPVAF